MPTRPILCALPPARPGAPRWGGLMRRRAIRCVVQHDTLARGDDALTGRCSQTHHRVKVATLARGTPGTRQGEIVRTEAGPSCAPNAPRTDGRERNGRAPVYEVNRLRPPAGAPCPLLRRGRITAQLLVPPEKDVKRSNPRSSAPSRAAGSSALRSRPSRHPTWDPGDGLRRGAAAENLSAPRPSHRTGSRLPCVAGTAAANPAN